MQQPDFLVKFDFRDILTSFVYCSARRGNNTVSTTMEAIGNVITNVALGVETDSWSASNKSGNGMQQQQQQQMQGDKNVIF